jgi:hypothetical protein
MINKIYRKFLFIMLLIQQNEATLSNKRVSRHFKPKFIRLQVF